MKTVFISNYFNHHQKPLSDALDRLTGGNYRFIATSEMRRERRELGYGGWEIPGYVLDFNSEAGRSESLAAIENADVLITGSCPRELFRRCVFSGKPVFNYSERIRKIDGLYNDLRLTAAMLRRIPRKDNIYLLAAGAYTYGDYARLGYFKDRAYKWGYFPEVKEYGNVDALISAKKKNSILWAGRLIKYKHAEHIIKAAEILSSRGIDFTIEIIGSGEKKDELSSLIEGSSLGERIKLTGSMPPEQVRRRMEESAVFVITADKEEGWGAVANEAMNSGCAVVSSDAPGSAPYLFKNGENGIIYKYGDVSALAEGIALLLNDEEKRVSLGKAAYDTVADLWNAYVAAERFITLAESILGGEKHPLLFADGPCSRAEKINY